MVPDLIADAFDLEPGDMIEITGDRRTVSLKVGGIYRSLYSQPRRDYWLPWSEQIFPQCFDCSAPPQFILVGPKELVDLTKEVGERDADLGWVAPVNGLPLSLDEARQVNLYTHALIQRGDRSADRSRPTVPVLREGLHPRAASWVGETRSSARRCRS